MKRIIAVLALTLCTAGCAVVGPAQTRTNPNPPEPKCCIDLGLEHMPEVTP